MLTAALLGVGSVAVGHVAQTKSERHVEGEIAEIEQAAIALLKTEDLPPQGQAGARRVMTVELPDDSVTEEPIERFTIRRVDGNGSIAEYAFEGGPTHQQHIDAPIEGPDGETIEFQGTSTSYDVTLALSRDDAGNAVILLRKRG
jgi:hypothetical protein